MKIRWSNQNSGLLPLFAPDTGDEGKALSGLSEDELGKMLDEIGSQDPEEGESGQKGTSAPDDPGEGQPEDPTDEHKKVAPAEEGSKSGDSEKMEEPAEKPDSKEPYTQDELIALGASGNWHELDTTRIPAELQAVYQSFNAAFTRSSQKLAAERKRYEEAMEKARQQPAQQQPQQTPQQPQQPKMSRQEQWQQVDKYIIDEVCKNELNIDPDDFDEFDRVHKLAYNAKYQELAERAKQQQAQLKEKQTQKEKAEQAVREAKSFAAETLDDRHQADPDYGNVINFYPTYREEVLTVKQNRDFDKRFGEALEAKDAKTLESLYQEMRTAMYAHTGGEPVKEDTPGKRSKTPPPVMKPGSRTKDRADNGPSRERLSKMDDDQLGGLLSDLSGE